MRKIADQTGVSHETIRQVVKDIDPTPEGVFDILLDKCQELLDKVDKCQEKLDKCQKLGDKIDKIEALLRALLETCQMSSGGDTNMEKEKTVVKEEDLSKKTLPSNTNTDSISITDNNNIYIPKEEEKDNNIYNNNINNNIKDILLLQLNQIISDWATDRLDADILEAWYSKIVIPSVIDKGQKSLPAPSHEDLKAIESIKKAIGLAKLNKKYALNMIKKRLKDLLLKKDFDQTLRDLERWFWGRTKKKREKEEQKRILKKEGIGGLVKKMPKKV